MARTADYYIDAATAAFNVGFSSKAGQKAALADLNRAYSMLRDAAHKAQIDAAPMPINDDYQTRMAFFAENEMPFELHQVRERHLPIFEKWTQNSAVVASLRELRETIKGAEITPPVKAEPSKYEVKARETLMDLITRRKSQYLEAIHLGEVFGGLPVSANTHMVTNEHGTTFLRTFYYLNDKLTPLNLIIAAAEELERRAKK